jgi:hypothetical protein
MNTQRTKEFGEKLVKLLSEYNVEISAITENNGYDGETVTGIEFESISYVGEDKISIEIGYVYCNAEDISEEIAKLS